MTTGNVFIDARIATLAEGAAPYGLIEDAALAVEGDRIAWVGPRDALPARYAHFERLSLQGRLVTPGLIDCHTHLIFAGDRAREFEMRLNGAGYQAIARAGGGISTTVRATRASDLERLIEQALPRVDALIAEGITTLEIKSGYGLDIETEIRMLRAARRIGQLRPVRVVTTFLGAHSVPEEYAGRSDAYIDGVAIPALRAAHDQGCQSAFKVDPPSASNFDPPFRAEQARRCEVFL